MEGSKSRRAPSDLRILAGSIGAVTIALGAWALVSPRTFFEQLATFPPYNAHLLHDVGAFQVGLGTTLILAAVWTDALRVALSGVGVGFVLHTVSHVVDADLGGRSTDPFAIGALALLVVGGAVWHHRRSARTRPDDG